MIQPQGIIIHFFTDFFGKDLLAKPEAKEMNELLAKTPRAFHFRDKRL